MKKTVTLDASFTAKAEHCSIECRAEPLEHVFDESELGRGPAAAIATAIATGIRNIAAPAAGRHHKEFNVTGHLARNIHAVPVGKEWAVVPPPDRLNRDPKLLERLRGLVPVIDNPLAAPAVVKAIEATPAVIIRKRSR